MLKNIEGKQRFLKRQFISALDKKNSHYDEEGRRK
jgi:hypothetical protein